MKYALTLALLCSHCGPSPRYQDALAAERAAKRAYWACWDAHGTASCQAEWQAYTASLDALDRIPQ